MAKKSKGERKIEKELLYVLGFMVFLVIIYLISSSVFKSMGQIEYEGLTFTKEKFGEIPVFKTFYYFKGLDGKLIQYHLYLRHDPRTNPVPIKGDKIKFAGNFIYITMKTTYLRECEDMTIAVADLARFMAENQFDVKAANMDFTEAAIHKQPYVTCEEKPLHNVIQVRRGNSTEINVKGRCVDITIGEDCRALEAVEKFKVHSFLDAQKR